MYNPIYGGKLLNKEEYEKKLNEKKDLIMAAINEKDDLRALTVIDEQINYVEQISKKVDDSNYFKWLKDFSEKADEANQINNAKKTPFMLKLKDLSTAVFITMWVTLLMSVIMIFLGFRSGSGIIITFWCSYIFYYGIRGYLETTLKVKFPKIKRKDKKEGVLLFEEYKQEVDIAKAIHKFYEENHKN